MCKHRANVEMDAAWLSSDMESIDKIPIETIGILVLIHLCGLALIRPNTTFPCVWGN